MAILLKFGSVGKHCRHTDSRHQLAANLLMVTSISCQFRDIDHHVGILTGQPLAVGTESHVEAKQLVLGN